jgi:Cu/Ag efflux protein CusF
LEAYINQVVERFDKAYEEQKENSARKVDLKRKEVREKHEQISNLMMARFKAKIQDLDLQLERFKEENKKKIVSAQKSELENRMEMWKEDFNQKCVTDIARVDATEEKEKLVLDGIILSLL